METEDTDYAEKKYPQEFEVLKGIFEDHFSSEVIAGVLQDCCGDVNLAVDNLTKIEGSTNTPVNQPINTELECNNTAVTESHVNNMATNNFASLHAHSYAMASWAPVTAMGAQPAVRSPPKNSMPKIDYWTPQIKKIVQDYYEGNKTIILMRGAPGSGKTYLARVIVESTVGVVNSNNYEYHIFSSDDHMETNGKYHYNVNRLDEAHMKNQMRVHKAVTEGRSPVIVDNTNMKNWEMYPYVRDAVMNGYIIEVVEPSTPWSQIPSQLAKRNSHGVPKEKIQLMLQKYEGTHTGESLIKYFKLCYPKGKEPPVKRNIPPFSKQDHLLSTPPEKLKPVIATCFNKQNQVHQDIELASRDRQNSIPNINETPRNVNNTSITSKFDESSIRDNQVHEQQTEAKKNLEEILKEVEWNIGKGWETPLSKRELNVEAGSSLNPEPPRSPKEKQPSMLHDESSNDVALATETSQINTQSDPISTLVDEHKTITGPRDDTEILNDNKTEPNRNKITNKYTTFTGRCVHEEKHFVQLRKMFKNVPRAVLREIFDNCAGDVDWACSIVLDGIQQNNLNAEESEEDEEEDVDFQCQCDQLRNDIIPDTMLPIAGEKASPIALPTYKKKTKKEKNLTSDSIIIKRQIENSVMISDHNYSQNYLNLRRQRFDSKSPNGAPYENPKETITPEKACKPEISIESNSHPLPESSFDAHVPGNSHNNQVNATKSSAKANDAIQSTSGTINNEVNATASSAKAYDAIPSTSGTSNNQVNATASSAKAYDAIPSTSGTSNNQVNATTSSAKAYDAIPSTSGDNLESQEDDEEVESEFDNISTGSDTVKSGVRGNVTVNIGMEFVRKLDELYGRHDFEYPEGVNPVLSVPTGIMLQFNALWMESITYQLDKVQTQTEKMIKQDEEFARKLELELQLEAEAEANANSLPLAPEKTNQPQEPQSFKEIMDTDLALAIYEKEVREEWKNKEPQDLAAQMTRRKLYELFPDVAHETLSEMLIAHGNSFDNTVEVLLISTGQGHYLDEANSINKFVMEKEKENKAMLMLAEQNAALDEEEYPYLLKPGQEHTELNMDLVNQMRDKAEMHKNARDIYFRKAKWYYERKKLAEATYYSRIAALHTARYDKASNYAAAVLVQYHAELHPGTNVIDLHFLRVPEAENSLDLFIDDRLRKLRRAADQRPIVLHIITGRGKHSPGRPRVKPAIMKRLIARGLPFQLQTKLITRGQISYRQQNPGLLEARLRPTHLLLEELLNS